LPPRYAALRRALNGAQIVGRAPLSPGVRERPLGGARDGRYGAGCRDRNCDARTDESRDILGRGYCYDAATCQT